MSMAIFTDTADMTANKANSVKDIMYIDLLPMVSENDDHQSGKMDMESIYMSTDKLTTVAVLLNVDAISTSAGKTIEEPIGAAAPANATIAVTIHFIFRG